MSYVNLTEANEYFSDRLHADAWAEVANADKGKARKGDYAAMTVVELKEYAAGMGIDVPARAKKNDIIIAIMETEVV